MMILVGIYPDIKHHSIFSMYDVVHLDMTVVEKFETQKPHVLTNIIFLNNCCASNC